MQEILRQNNLGLLREIERSNNLLKDAAKTIPAELDPYYNWAATACSEFHQRAMQNLHDLDLHQKTILPDILSATQTLTRDFYLFNQRQISPILRARSSDRLCLKLLRWLHSVHSVTRDIPMALSDEEFQIWPVLPTIYFMPPSAQSGLLYLSLFFHEFGHLLYASHKPEMDDLVRSLQEEIEELLKPSAQRDDLHAEREIQRRKMIVERWYEWTQELFCDAVGLCIGSVSFLHAFSMYMRMRGREAYHIPQDELGDQSHPVTWLRVRILYTRAHLMGFESEAVTIEEAWSAIADAMNIAEDYYGYYTPEFEPVIQRTIDNILTEAAPFGLNKQQHSISSLIESSPLPLLHEAWKRFFHDLEVYSIWEKQAVAAYLT